MARSTMIPVGYMAKQVEQRPEWFQAQQLLESSQFKEVEPGPYRIFAAYSVEWH